MLKVLTDEIGSRPLGLARIIVGGAAALRALVAWRVLTALAEPATLNAPYADWMPRPTMGLAVTIVAVWFVSAVLFAVGWRVPISGTILLVAITFTLGLDRQTYSNHLYLMAWLVLLLVIANAGSGLNISRQDRPVVRWPVLLIMAQLSVVYGFSAITKLNAGFLSGRALAGVLGRGVLSFPEALRDPAFLRGLAFAVVVIELFIALFIWRSKWRGAAIVLGLALHVSIVLLLRDTAELVVFALEMLAIYPLFLGSQSMVVLWDDANPWLKATVDRLQAFDVLRFFDFRARGGIGQHEIVFQDNSLEVVSGDGSEMGFAATIRILEHGVPTLWFAPVLRLPGIRHAGNRWFRARVAAPSPEPSEPSL